MKTSHLFSQAHFWRQVYEFLAPATVQLAMPSTFDAIGAIFSPAKASRKRQRSTAPSPVPAMTALFRAICSGEVEASRYSFHSFRIGLATALLAAGYDYPAIKAHCRWSSDASVKLYGRQTPEAFGERLMKASTQTVTPGVVAQFLRDRICVDPDTAVSAARQAAGIAIHEDAA